jgi:tRNA A37 threonylcarbamoyladenosine biosynthesis protein TsaE
VLRKTEKKIIKMNFSFGKYGNFWFVDNRKGSGKTHLGRKISQAILGNKVISSPIFLCFIIAICLLLVLEAARISK